MNSAMRLAAVSVAMLLAACGPAGTVRAAGNDRSASAAGYSAAELYNAANAYARAGNAALAVLDYERARVLAPRDADIEANLGHVRELAGVPGSNDDWLERYGRFADPDLVYWLALSGLVLAGVCVLRLRARPRRRAAWRAGAGFGLVLALAGMLNAAATLPLLSESVALRPLTAGVSPVAGADALFTLPAASTVRVLDRHGGFALIRDTQAREGWVAAVDLGAVIPDGSSPAG